MDPDADSGGPKTYGFFGSVSGTLVHYIIFSKIKFIEKLQNIINQGFSYYFRLMMEGSVPEPDPYLCLTDPDADPGGLKTLQRTCCSFIKLVRDLVENPTQCRTSVK